MPTQVQFRRGTTSQNGSFTGAVGELSVDTTLDTVLVHDGSTAGGHRLAKFSEIQAGDITGVTAGTGLSGGGTGGAVTVNLSHLGLESLSDPDDDQIVFWDDSAGATAFLDLGSNLSITGTTLNATDTNTTYTVGDGGLTTNDFTAADHSKLDAIEAAADVTDTTNVTAAGALMDSELSDLAAVKAIDQSLVTTATPTFDTIIAKGLKDADGDTKIQVEESADEDTIRFDAAGTEVMSMTSTGLFPSTDDTFSLGSSSLQWKDVFVGPGSLYVNGQKVIEDNSGTISISADANQNVSVQTSGSGNVELDATGSGLVSVKSTLQIEDGSNITNSAGNAITFGSGLAADSLTSKSTDTNLVLAGNGSGNVQVSDNLTVTGDFTVSGTTTTVSSSTLTVADLNITVAQGAANAAAANGGGLTVDGAAATLTYTSADDRWNFNKTLNATLVGDVTGDVTGNVSGSAGTATGNAGTATTLATARTIGGVSFDGSANINLPGVNATGNQATSGNAATSTLAAGATALATARTIGGVSFDGTAAINLPGVNAAGNQSTSGLAATATALATARAIAVSGDVTGTANFDGTGNISISTTIAANSVALGTDTTGNFMTQVSGGNGITVSHTPGEGSTATLTGTSIYNAAGTLLN
tara:strand:- start:824 stop:2755 length:1932 start_codon:yes stop_codon:yes gene_type:complete